MQNPTIEALQEVQILLEQSVNLMETIIELTHEKDKRLHTLALVAKEKTNSAMEKIS